jgi:hypothetical protein
MKMTATWSLSGAFAFLTAVHISEFLAKFLAPHTTLVTNYRFLIVWFFCCGI